MVIIDGDQNEGTNLVYLGDGTLTVEDVYCMIVYQCFCSTS